MSIDLLKRSELSRGMTNAEMDANLTAIETFINAILAGTVGYEAGNALKLGGVLAANIIPQSGSWTPSPSNLTVSGTPTYVGRYVKIGSVVHVTLDISSTGSTTSSGINVLFSGLPFTPNGNAACSVVGFNVENLGSGLIYQSGAIYVPAWTALPRVIVSGFYLT